jgi:hypothetical protein
MPLPLSMLYRGKLGYTTLRITKFMRANRISVLRSRSIRTKKLFAS